MLNNQNRVESSLQNKLAQCCRKNIVGWQNEPRKRERNDRGKSYNLATTEKEKEFKIIKGELITISWFLRCHSHGHNFKFTIVHFHVRNRTINWGQQPRLAGIISSRLFNTFFAFSISSSVYLFGSESFLLSSTAEQLCFVLRIRASERARE